jgi:hypothetical protein
VRGITKIISVPTKLESTTLVIALGQDIFITRVAPSKYFDILSKDFSYSGLILTFVLLVVGIAVSKHFADSKELSELWY